MEYAKSMEYAKKRETPIRASPRGDT